jgi:hypothetical protein
VRHARRGVRLARLYARSLHEAATDRAAGRELRAQARRAGIDGLEAQ